MDLDGRADDRSGKLVSLSSAALCALCVSLFSSQNRTAISAG
jgi:hypothetical protein